MSILAPGPVVAQLLYAPGDPGLLHRLVDQTWQFWSQHLSPWHYFAMVLIFAYARQRLLTAAGVRETRARAGRPGMLDQQVRRHWWRR